jgi:endonuclease/exonuclease/phosphatase (EEP) superfamily protein YafD
VRADADADGGVPAPRGPGRTAESRWTGGLVVCCWSGLAFLWLVIAIWALRLGEHLTVVWAITAGLHLLLLAAWVVLILAVALRRWALAGAAVATVAVQLFVAWPMAPRRQAPPGPGRRVHLASANLYVDNADPDAAARDLMADPPDILVVQELTPAVATALRRHGLARRFPHRVEHPDPGTTGEAIYSRFPLEEIQPRRPLPDVLVAVATLPDGTRLRIHDVHAFTPQPGDPAIWSRDIHTLDRALSRSPRPWIAVGDFNATSDQRIFRDLIHSGRHDAHQLDGRGYARSWPANKVVPPLVLIDHAVLSPGLGAAHTSERTITGSDHREIQVTVVIQR